MMLLGTKIQILNKIYKQYQRIIVFMLVIKHVYLYIIIIYKYMYIQKHILQKIYRILFL